MRERKSEDVTAIISVFAIPPTYSLLGPSPTAIGINANAVVAVAANKGINKCLTDLKIACFELSPSSLLYL